MLCEHIHIILVEQHHRKVVSLQQVARPIEKMLHTALQQIHHQNTEINILTWLDARIALDVSHGFRISHHYRISHTEH